MLVLKTCTGDACADPYSKLLPHDLKRHGPPGFADLLHRDLDEYFAQLPKVSFKACGLGYHRALEQPEWNEALAPRRTSQGQKVEGIVFQQGYMGRLG